MHVRPTDWHLRAAAGGAAAAAATSQPRIADTRLGALVLRLLPGQLYYLPALLFPLASALAAVGAVRAPAIAQYIAAMPLVQVRRCRRSSGALALAPACM